MHELRGEDEPKLDEILARLAPCDLVLVEGYKRESHPKIETRRLDAKDTAPLSADRSATSAPWLPIMRSTGETIPVFAIDDVAAIADFIAGRNRPARRSPTETALPTSAVLRLIFSKKEWEYRARGWLGSAGRWPRGRLANP